MPGPECNEDQVTDFTKGRMVIKRVQQCTMELFADVGSGTAVSILGRRSIHLQENSKGAHNSPQLSNFP